jgi:hypothetical protein
MAIWVFSTRRRDGIKSKRPKIWNGWETPAGHPDGHDSLFVSITRCQMPIVSSYTIARRRQPNHIGCVGPMGCFGAIWHNGITTSPSYHDRYEIFSTNFSNKWGTKFIGITVSMVGKNYGHWNF